MQSLLTKALREFSRFLHLTIIKLFVAPIFSVATRDLEGKLHLRNSVLERDYFHWLFSDIDIAISLNQIENSSVARIRHIHNLLRKVYRHLGELEIYTHSEYRELCALKARNVPWVSKLRSVRKLVWKFSEAEPKSKLRRLQRTRSLHTLNMRLQLTGIKQLSDVRSALIFWSSHIDSPNSEFSRELNTYFHSFFSVPLISDADCVNKGFKLGDRALLTLATCVPLRLTQAKANLPFILELFRKSLHQKRIIDFYRTEVLEVLGSSRGLPIADAQAEYATDLSSMLVCLLAPEETRYSEL